MAGFVTLSAKVSLSSEEIMTYCRQKLPAFKVPKSVLVLDELPKNDRGKIDRKALINLWSARCADLERGS